MHHKKLLAATSTILSLCVSLALYAAEPTSRPAPNAKPAAKKTAAKKTKKPAAKKTTQSWPDQSGFYNAAQTDLGAIAFGSGAPFNKDWPAINAIGPESAKARGTLIGNPMTGARVDIKLAAPVDIKAIETVGLDYHGTRQPKAIDIYVDGKMVKHAELENKPNQPVRTPLEAHGKDVAVVITDQYDVRDLPDGKKGPTYGGWARIRVLTPTDLSPLMKPPAQYQVAASSDNITPTTGAIAGGKVEVVGQPRNDTGHPNTIWDKTDIEHYKDMLKTSKELQTQLAALVKAMDLRLARPATAPEPKKDAKGEYRHVSDKEGDWGKVNNDLSLDIANLGTVYALTGEEKYGDYCKKLLLAYADNFANYRPGNRPGFTHDEGILFDQRLSDATWLIQVARGYDLIHDLPSITTEERQHIENDVLKADAKFITGNHAVLEAPTNWSAICTCAVLTVGYATDDQHYINTGLYGLPAEKDKAKGGMYLHFSDKTIADDGMWSEGSTGYQFMAMEALLADAEIMWHHGVDMYRYRDGALKRLFDSPIRYAYPDLQTPAVSDGGGGSIIAYESNLWELGYERYRDPQYMLILSQAAKNLRAEFQKWPVSVLYDVDTKTATKPPEWKPVNLFSVGMGILRMPDDPNQSMLTFLYGKEHSHGHPDKLSFDLYAMGNRFMMDPGSVWYEQPLYKQWYHTTLAHNAMVVDFNDQQPCTAELITYGTARTMGIERGATTEAYPGLTLDRSLFMTPQYVADIYGAFGNIEHTMDLAYHAVGTLDTQLPLQPDATPQNQLPNGYDVIQDLKSTTTPDAWSATIKAKKGTARFLAAAGPSTEVLIGKGYYHVANPPVIIERRNAKSTIFGNVVDISGNADYVKSVKQDGDLDKGYSLLTITTARGTDLAYTSFRAGPHTAGDAGGLETDAQQALITRDGNNVRSAFLAGGTSLKVGDVTLQRSEPGLASFEQTESGNYLLANPSPKEATITVTDPAFNGLQAFALDNEGKRTGPAKTTGGNGAPLVVTLAPNAQIELAKPGAPSFLEAAEAAAKKRQEAREADLAKARAQADARSKTRITEAETHPAPANTTVVVQAEDFTNQGGGQVSIAANKTATIGKAILKFDANDQWLEYEVNVPADGYYNLSACYCSIDPSDREIAINGHVQEPLAPFHLDATGGFANGSDDWKIATAKEPGSNTPLLLKFNKGKNTLRITNTTGRSSNLDYLLITSPDVKPTRIKQNP
jgi:hypothetical protein